MTRALLLVFLTTMTQLAMGESLVIEPKHARFEASTASSVVKQVYTISNRGNKPVEIRDWKAISERGEVINLPKTLSPGNSAEFSVHLSLPGTLGESGFRYALFTDEADVERYRFTLSGFVYSLVAPENPVVNLGKIQSDSTEKSNLNLEARESEPLQLIRVLDAPDWVDAKVKDTTLTVGIRPGASRGIKAGNIRLATNLAQQPEVEVLAKAIIEGELKPSTYVLGFNPTEVGLAIHSDLEFRYTGKGKLSDLEIDATEEWKMTRSACEGSSDGKMQCMRLALDRTIQESGQVTGSLNFSMPGEPALSIPFGIMGLKSGQTVRELLVRDDDSVAPVERIDITKAITKERDAGATDFAASPEAASTKPSTNIAKAKGSGPVRLRWKAANDASIYGFMIYRAKDRAGPYSRITSRPLPKHSGTSPAGSEAEYEFVDESVEPGRTYFYYIDSMAKNGTQQRLSPVLSKTVTP